MTMLLSIVLLLMVGIVHTTKAEDYCAHTAYPPSSKNKIDTYIVNLDLPADRRWTRVVQHKRSQIKKILWTFMEFMMSMGTKTATKLIDLIDRKGKEMDNALPQPFADEISGIAKDTGLELGEIVLYNIIYEIFSMCTSIIAEDQTGSVILKSLKPQVALTLTKRGCSRVLAES